MLRDALCHAVAAPKGVGCIGQHALWRLLGICGDVEEYICICVYTHPGVVLKDLVKKGLLGTCKEGTTAKTRHEMRAKPYTMNPNH